MTCSVKGCTNVKIEAKKLCKMHYSRQWKTGDVGEAERRNVRHGLSAHSLYHTWEAMHQRCADHNAANYHLYGARGIKVCKRWRDFSLFLEDMGEKPKGMTLDRVNVSGNYTPKNCRWATHIQQQNNKRNNKLLEYSGETKSHSQWARELDIPKSTISGRVAKGYPIEAILSTKVMTGKRTYGRTTKLSD